MLLQKVARNLLPISKLMENINFKWVSIRTTNFIFKRLKNWGKDVIVPKCEVTMCVNKGSFQKVNVVKKGRETNKLKDSPEWLAKEKKKCYQAWIVNKSYIGIVLWQTL